MAVLLCLRGVPSVNHQNSVENEGIMIYRTQFSYYWCEINIIISIYDKEKKSESVKNDSGQREIIIFSYLKFYYRGFNPTQGMLVLCV